MSTEYEQLNLDKLVLAGKLSWVILKSKETQTMNRLVKKGLAKEVNEAGIVFYLPVDKPEQSHPCVNRPSRPR